MVAPEVGEAHEAQVLEKEEREAEAAAVFRMVDDGHGKCHGRFTSPAHVGDAPARPCSPRRPETPRRGGRAGARTGPALGAPAGCRRSASTSSATPPTAPPGRRGERHRGGHHDPGDPDGRAEGRPARHRPPDQPRAWPGGSPAGPGSSPPSSAASPRSSTWAGRRRFHTEPQRIALAIEQGGCTAEGCDWPPGHVPRPPRPPLVTRAATPSVKNGRLLCPSHHARAHDPAYTITKLPDGKVRFHRRT